MSQSSTKAALVAIGDIHVSKRTTDDIAYSYLTKAIDDACKDEENLVIAFMGDLFDKPSPTFEEIRFIIKLVTKIINDYSHAEIVIIPGNHDGYGPLSLLPLIGQQVRILSAGIHDSNLLDDVKFIAVPDSERSLNEPKKMIKHAFDQLDEADEECQYIMLGHLPILMEETKMMATAVDPESIIHDKLLFSVFGDIHVQMLDEENEVYVPGSSLQTNFSKHENEHIHEILKFVINSKDKSYTVKKFKSDYENRMMLLEVESEKDLRSDEYFTVHEDQTMHVKVFMNFETKIPQSDLKSLIRKKIGNETIRIHDIDSLKNEIDIEEMENTEASELKEMTDEEIFESVLQANGVESETITRVLAYHATHKDEINAKN